MIENNIRYAQNKLRGLIATYPVDFKGLKLLILILLICALYLTGNYFQCTSNYGDSPPWEALFGEKVDYKRHFKYHPGELVEAHMGTQSNYNSTLRSKTTPAMVLLGTGASNCSYRCLNLETGRLITPN